MWQAQLVHSNRQFLFLALIYKILFCLIIILFRNTIFEDEIWIMTNILSIEWIVACLAIRKIKGELAIFYDLNELYWSRERWFIIGKPIFFRYAVLIPIRAKRNNQNRVLFLMNDNFSIKDWRSLLYILRIFI